MASPSYGTHGARGPIADLRAISDGMDAALITLIVTFLAMQGGWGQLTVASLSAASGRSWSLLVSALSAVLLASGLVAWLGATISAQLVGPWRAALVALPLVLGALLLFRRQPYEPLLEPTRSLGAIQLALLAKLLADPARLAIFASAAALALPAPAFIGGAIGSGLALAIGWFLGERATRFEQASVIRKAAGAIFIALALLIGWIGLNP